MLRYPASLLALLLLCTPVFSHDVWLEPEGKGHVLVYGHPGELEAYDPAKTKSVTGIDGKGARHKVSTHVHDSRLMLDPSPGLTLVAVDFDNGFWTQDKNEKSVNKSKREVPDYKSAIHSKKFSKALLAWGDSAGKPIGADFEIVPLANPLKMKEGDMLPIQLLYMSKPLAGAEVEIIDNMDIFTTDADGKTSLPLSAGGFQYIQASYRIPLDNHPDADTLSLSTNLTFRR